MQLRVANFILQLDEDLAELIQTNPRFTSYMHLFESGSPAPGLPRLMLRRSVRPLPLAAEPAVYQTDAGYPLKVYKTSSAWYHARHYHPRVPPLVYGYQRVDEGERRAVLAEAWNILDYHQVCLDFLHLETGHLFARMVLDEGGLVLHAVVMRWRGRAILFSAASGIGKTTQAGLWRQAVDVDIINGDRALCTRSEGNWTVHGQPWCGSSRQCLNTSAPLGAIVLLEQAGVNEAERLSPFDAVLGLLPRVFAPPWDPASLDKVLTALDSITEQVPVLRLRCRPDLDAVHTLKRELDSLLFGRTPG